MPMPRTPDGTWCESCGRAPVKRVRYTRLVGMVMAVQTYSNQVWLCRDCGQSIVRSFQSKTLLQGWWGFTAFFFNIGAVLGNTKTLLSLRRLASPAEPGGLDPGRPVFLRSGMLIVPGVLAVIAGIGIVSALDESAPLEVGSCVRSGSGDSVKGVECSVDNEGEFVSEVGDPLTCEAWTEWYVEVTETGLGAGPTTYLCVDNHVHPATWDPALADLTGFVEETWGAEFDHPVEVIEQTPDEFIARLEAEADAYADVVGTEGGPEASSVEDVAGTEDGPDLWLGELRALGLVVGEPDLYGESAAVDTEPVEAEFDPYTEQIYVRDDLPEPWMQMTLVHELTHALQHQTHGLNRLTETDEEWRSWQMLIEGDARDVENQYHATLSEAEVAEVDAYLGDQRFDPAAVEPYLALESAAPYELGSAMLYLTRTLGGNEAVQDLYRRDEVTTDQLLNYAALQSGEVGEDVPAPDPPEGEESQWESDFGALALWHVLAGRIDDTLAREAVGQWAGGTIVDTLDDDDRVCVNLRLAADEAAGLDVLEQAMQAWADPARSEAEVTRNGAYVDVRSCDPGPDGLPADLGELEDAFWIPGTEAYALAGTLEPGDDSDAVACALDAIREVLTTEELRGLEVPPDERLDELTDAIAACSTG